MLERVHAHFPPEPALLVPAKRRRRVVNVVGVDPDGARLKLSRHVMGLLDIPGPDGRRQTIRCRIRTLDGLVQVGEIDGRQDRAEDLFARDR